MKLYSMYKIKVHIASDSTYIDENVCVQIKLPAVPRKGETLYLDEDLQQALEDKAKSNLKIAKDYFPKWFYGNSYKYKEPKEKILSELSFDDARNIISVTYISNSDIIHIELDN